MMKLKVEMKVMMMEILCNKMEAAQKMNRRPREACKWPPVTQKGPTNWNYDEDGVLVTVPTRVHWFRAVDKCGIIEFITYLDLVNLLTIFFVSMK